MNDTDQLKRSVLEMLSFFLNKMYLRWGNCLHIPSIIRNGWIYTNVHTKIFTKKSIFMMDPKFLVFLLCQRPTLNIRIRNIWFFKKKGNLGWMVSDWICFILILSFLTVFGELASLLWIYFLFYLYEIYFKYIKGYHI